MYTPLREVINMKIRYDPHIDALDIRLIEIKWEVINLSDQP